VRRLRPAGAGFALVHSPLVGAACWRGVAAQLRRQGARARAIDYGGVSGPDWYGGAAGRIAGEIQGFAGGAVLVLHSGAGALAPSIIAAAAAAPSAVVFVDAILPHPGRSWLQAAPPALAARLRRLAGDGVLPPWTGWFADNPAARLIADDRARAEFEAGLPRLALAFLESAAPDVALDAGARVAFLRLSEAYQGEAAEAARRGWTVQAAPMHHLAMITDPQGVARRLADLAAGVLADG
jgi:hypothetical protein